MVCTTLSVELCIIKEHQKEEELGSDCRFPLYHFPIMTQSPRQEKFKIIFYLLSIMALAVEMV